MNKYTKAVNILEKHYEEHRAVSSADLELLVDLFPEYVVNFLAYRCVILKPMQEPKENFLYDKNKSWSASLEGVKKFLRNEDVDMFWDNEDVIYLYSAQVSGFSLSLIAEDLVKHNYMNKSQGSKFFEEDELLSRHVSNLKLCKTFKFHEFDSFSL
jgi:hypothetical protein